MSLVASQTPKPPMELMPLSTSLPNSNRLLFFFICPPIFAEVLLSLGETLTWDSFGDVVLAIDVKLPALRGDVGVGGRTSVGSDGSGGDAGGRGRGLMYDKGGEEG